MTSLCRKSAGRGTWHLIDATDVMVVQQRERLDLEYIRHWGREHGSETRLDKLLADQPRGGDFWSEPVRLPDGD